MNETAAKMSPILHVLFGSLLFYGQVSCFPSGAPSSTCETMKPVHMVSAQSTRHFNVDVTNLHYQPDTPINVTIQSSGSVAFIGLLLKAREVGKNKAIGSFLNLPRGVKYLNCNSNSKGAITHSGRGSWSSFNVAWSPPEDISSLGNIEFVATVVKEYTIFWVKLASPELSKVEP